MNNEDRIEEMSGRLVKLEKSLSATRLVVRITAAAAIIGWLCLGTVLVYFKIARPHEITVKDELGNQAVLSGTGLTFESPKGAPVAWFSVAPVPNLQMTVAGAPAVRLSVSSLEDPYGFLWLRDKNGDERTITPKRDPAAKQ